MENTLTNPPNLDAGERIYVIGDVHGHRDRLARIHAQVRADLHRRPVAKPVLIHLGDLIDRGPDSAGCVAALAAGPPIRGVPTVNLMGNHEWLMLNALNTESHDDITRWLDNGGAETLRSWGISSQATPGEWLLAIPPLHLVLLRDLQRTHVAGNYLFVHAGVRPGTPLAKQRETDLLWIRESFLNWDGVMLPEAPRRVIVHGHTPAEKPVLRPNRIGLDTGAGKGGPLTCAVLERDGIAMFNA